MKDKEMLKQLSKMEAISNLELTRKFLGLPRHVDKNRVKELVTKLEL